MAFDKFKRALTLFATSLLVFSYLHYFEMHATAHDKLLRALTASELTSQVLSDDEEWLMLLSPPQHHPRGHSSGTISTQPGILVLTLLPSFYFLCFSFCLVVDIRILFLLVIILHRNLGCC